MFTQLEQQDRRKIHPTNTYWVKTIFRPALKRAAYASLIGRNRDRSSQAKGRFTRNDVNGILLRVWEIYDQIAPQVPREPKIGNRMNMLLACMTFACLQAMLATGVERRYTIELIGDVAWKVYEKWGRWAGFISNFLARGARDRLRMSVNLFLRFPFTPPGYLFERIPSQEGISLDMLRCPVADYFRTLGASDLCVGTWCNLDFPLAEKWGGRLERTQTLAAGQQKCDFRFTA